jgi:hypothetical protein|tara:strand:+ start:337 stop:528 length:192 start_codon:yes stop_codon:yes gene_type:complete
MISSILYYLVIGLFLNWAYDTLIDWSEAENRFTITERLAVMFFWPIALALFIYHYLKQFSDNE